MSSDEGADVQGAELWLCGGKSTGALPGVERVRTELAGMTIGSKAVTGSTGATKESF